MLSLSEVHTRIKSLDLDGYMSRRQKPIRQILPNGAVAGGVFVDNAFRSADKQHSDIIQKDGLGSLPMGS